MAFEPDIKISIGKYTLVACESFTIERSVFQIGSKAIITLPSKAVLNINGNFEQVEFSTLFKRGDKITIKAGYNNLITEFEGFVDRTYKNTPFEIHCLDFSFYLDNLISKSWKSTSLKQLLVDISGFSKVKLELETGDDFPQIQLTNYIIKNASQIDALEKLKDNYGLLIYFTPQNKLYCGLSYIHNINKKVIFDADINISDYQSLEYINEEDVKLKVKAISYLRNNKKIEVETGDSSGDLRTLNFYNISDKSQLKSLANSEIKKYKYTGYRGSFTSFAKPYIEPGMAAEIRNNDFPDRTGLYHCDSTTMTFPTSGLKREIGIGVKING